MSIPQDVAIALRGLRGLALRVVPALAILLLTIFLVHGIRALGPGSIQRLGGVLLPWIPLLYGVVALSYAGRYWRWRLLLGRVGIGRTDWSDLLGWFRGFALTATPAKLGELSWVQLLHEQLGYPRLPLVHVFVAERCACQATSAFGPALHLKNG